MTEADHKLSEERLQKVLLGNQLVAIEMPAAAVWDFQFTGAHLNVGVPWRILDGQSIRLGSCDHDHKFGLPEPVDARSLAHQWLGGKKVEWISLASKTADLELGFECGFSLQVFNHSSGWEGWNIASKNGSCQVIALGGGDIAIFD